MITIDQNLVCIAGKGPAINVKGTMTLDEVIAKLKAMREFSPFGGDTVVAWCGVGSELETIDICDVRLEMCDSPEDGAQVMFYTDGPKLNDDF